MSDTDNLQLNTEPSLGRQLRSRREERGLSIEDVAHHLKIDASLLRDFEEEREPSHNLPEVYCKGFLRNYARYLKVTIEPGQIKACRTSDIRLNERGEEYNPKRPLLPYLLIATLVVGAGLFIFGDELNHKEQAAAPAATVQPVPQSGAAHSAAESSAVASSGAMLSGSTAQTTTPTAEAESGTNQVATTSESGATAEERSTEEAPTIANVAQGVATKETATEERAAEKTAAPTTESASVAAEAALGGDTSALSAVSSPAATEGDGESATAAPLAPAEVAPPATRGTVTIRYIDRSFTQITDGLGRVIVKRMLDAGAVEDFEGPLPLQINLGNAIGVRVKFNGEPFDHLNYIDDNNIAQFLLGGAE
jgi:cytoskeleton protein RodZ